MENFYISNKEEYPKLATLALIERGEYEKAWECYRAYQTKRSGYMWTIEPETDEQRIRLETSGAEKKGEHSYFRTELEAYYDYTVAMRNGPEWNKDRASYSLLPEERQMKK